MTLYDQLVNEGVEKTTVRVILNSFDNNIPIETIRLITGESIEKIKSILVENGRKI